MRSYMHSKKINARNFLWSKFHPIVIVHAQIGQSNPMLGAHNAMQKGHKLVL